MFKRILFLAILLFPISVRAWTEIGFNFRFSSGFVTDGANQTYVTGDVYPTSRGGAVFGWTSALADGTRDRDSAIDVRLAGSNKTGNTSPKSFKVDLPAAGNYTIYVAIGDGSTTIGSDHTSGHQYLQVRDNTDPLFTIDDASGTAAGHFDDATGVDRTAAAWPGSNAGYDITFSTTTAIFVLGDGATAGDSTIAHIRIVQGGGGGGPTTTTTTSSTTTTTLPPGSFATVEDLCPGGANHRSDIVWCANFETTTGCTTGQEAGCATNNGLTELVVANSDGFKIKPNGPDTAAVGNGYIEGSGKASGSSPGYATVTLPSSYPKGSLRGYVKFKAGFMQNESSTGNHGPSLNYSDVTGCNESGVVTPGGLYACCAGYISVDWTLKNPRIIIEPNRTTCGGHNPDGGNLTSNIGNFSPTIGVWYPFEIYSQLNTSATGTAVDAGNGTVRMWIAGTKVLEYTNVNIRGDSSVSKINELFPVRSYFGLGIPRWKPKQAYDALAFSDGTACASTTTGCIGRSANENNLGAADSNGPYWLGMGGDGAEMQKLSSDCTAGNSTDYNGYSSSAWANNWRDGKSYVTSPTPPNNYACDSECAASGCTGSHMMQAHPTAAGHGAGLAIPIVGINTTTAHRIVGHGSIQLKSTNDHRTSVPLMGIYGYGAGGGGADWNNYVALSTTGGDNAGNPGNWAVILRKDDVAGTTHTTNVAAVAGVNTDVELALDSMGKIYLTIAGVHVIDGITANQDTSWAYDDTAPGNRNFVFGVGRDSPDNNFYVWHDDMDVGGASFVDCSGWNTQPSGYSCPFSITNPIVSTGTSVQRGIFNLIRRLRHHG